MYYMNDKKLARVELRVATDEVASCLTPVQLTHLHDIATAALEYSEIIQWERTVTAMKIRKSVGVFFSA